MVPLPSRVWIKDTHFVVGPVPMREAQGQCHPQGMICIEEGQRGYLRASTFLHEIIHAILFRYGFNGGDERQVCAIETELIQLLRKCPEVRAVLLDGVVQCRGSGRKSTKPKGRRKMASYGKGGGKGKGKSGVCFDKPGSSQNPQKKRGNAGSLVVTKAPDPKKV